METSTLLLTIIFCFIVYYILVLSKKRPKNFPPGPPGIPIFGNALQLGAESYKGMAVLREKYGDIIGVKMGSLWVIYLHDADDVREVFSRVELTGKHHYNGLLDEPYGIHNAGIMVSEGRPWQEQRRFSLKTLRDFGFGKKSMESIILEEANQLVEELRSKINQPFSTTHAFNSSVFNVLWQIVAGERFPHNDPRLEELMKLLLEFIESILHGMKGFYFIFPSLVTIRDTFPFLFPNSKEFQEKLFAFLRKTIREHKKTLVEGSPRDFIDSYLEEMSKTKDPESSFTSKNNDDFELLVLLMDLFVGGGDTTSTTLTWSFFILALHPKEQEKLYKEIKTVIGNRHVSLSDRPSLPYVEATIMEIMRVSTLAPVGSPHTATHAQVFKGYSIPKNTVVFANLYAIHYRKDIWGDPEKFRPERFLSPDEKTVIRSKHLIPFGVGKRVCMGETLARDEVFLFLTNLCQQFRIGMPKGEPSHTMQLQPGAIPHPEPHQIILTERKF